MDLFEAIAKLGDAGKWPQTNAAHRLFRAEDLFQRLWGLPVELREQLAESVWDIRFPEMDMIRHRYPSAFRCIVGF